MSDWRTRWAVTETETTIAGATAGARAHRAKPAATEAAAARSMIAEATTAAVRMSVAASVASTATAAVSHRHCRRTNGQRYS